METEDQLQLLVPRYFFHDHPGHVEELWVMEMGKHG